MKHVSPHSRHICTLFFMILFLICGRTPRNRCSLTKCNIPTIFIIMLKSFSHCFGSVLDIRGSDFLKPFTSWRISYFTGALLVWRKLFPGDSVTGASECDCNYSVREIEHTDQAFYIMIFIMRAMNTWTLDGSLFSNYKVALRQICYDYKNISMAVTS